MAMPMMKCGHAANGYMMIDGKRMPVCVICLGIRDGAHEIDESPPSFEGRKAKCTYCGKLKDSSASLPFFKYHSDKEYDEYYCGCRGWD